MEVKTTIAAAVFDVVQLLGAEAAGTSLGAIQNALGHIDPSSVESAVHRLADMNKLKVNRTSQGTIYRIQIGATRPLDGRGRPRKVTHEN